MGHFFKFDPDQPRDERGRWVDKGGGAVLVSPNREDNPGLPRAQAKLLSVEQAQLHNLTQEIASRLGIKHDIRNAIGTWADNSGTGGAENSALVSFPKGTSFDDIRLIGAMQGYVFNQKAVLLFQPDPNGRDVVTQFTVRDKDVSGLMSRLHSAGVAYHTMVPERGGVRVFVLHPHQYDPQASINAVQAVAAVYGVPVETGRGRGEFIGDTDGNRARARADYTKIISRSVRQRGPDAVAFWAELRNRYGRIVKDETVLTPVGTPLGWQRAA